MVLVVAIAQELCNHEAVNAALEKKISGLTCFGPGEEWLLEVVPSEAGWCWRRPILDESGDYIVDAEEWTTTDPLITQLPRAWPICYNVNVDGLTDAEALAYLAPLAREVLAQGDEFVINGQSYDFDGAALRPSPS